MLLFFLVFLLPFKLYFSLLLYYQVNNFNRTLKYNNKKPKEK